MAKKLDLDLVEVDKARFKDAVKMYFLWKELDSGIRSSATRGVNFPETISEALCCYAMGFKWNKGSSGDAYDEKNNKIIEMKATSNWEGDRELSSFSPKEKFDNLFFLRLNKRDDELYIYDTGIDSEMLKKIKVNSSETVEQQQLAGRRPRFSVIRNLIEPLNIQYVAKINLRTYEIEKK